MTLLPQNNAITEFAAAKINLCLHVTGQRSDGYHLLDSVVAFASIGDRLEATSAALLSPDTDPAADAMSSLALSGPFGPGLPAGMDNLVLRAARAIAPAFATRFTLHKHLPPASGIGGGSADAAAAIRAVWRLQNPDRPFDPARLVALAPAIAALGADVPVCLASHPARMRGIGERLEPLALPDAGILLVNPGVEVPTPVVFRALTCRENPGLPETLPSWPDACDLALWLRSRRNDLEAPAQSIAPVIGEVLAALQALPGALIARMSGSGATCFALFPGAEAARAAGALLQPRHPDWWVKGGQLIRPAQG